MRVFRDVCVNNGFLLLEMPVQTLHQRSKLLQKLKQIVPYIMRKNTNKLLQKITQKVQSMEILNHLCKMMKNIKAQLFYLQCLGRCIPLKQIAMQVRRQKQYYVFRALRKIILFIIIFLAFILSSNIAKANMESEMKNFLFSNSSTNYSSGGAYKSQSRGYYAMPSVYTRNPVIDIKPISYAMPSFRGGCGGIDMFVMVSSLMLLINALPYTLNIQYARQMLTFHLYDRLFYSLQ